MSIIKFIRLRKQFLSCMLTGFLCISSITTYAAPVPSNAYLKQSSIPSSNDASNNTTKEQSNTIQNNMQTNVLNTETKSTTEEASSIQAMRGIYITTVLNLDFPTSPTTDAVQLQTEIDDIIKNSQALGFHSIFLQVRPCADAIYPSAIFPWSRYLTGAQTAAPSANFDPLAYFVQQAHANNMELHAWINPYRVTKKSSDWTTLSPYHPAKLHPEWVICYTDGNYYFDPAIPEVRQLILNGIAELVQNYDLDGIHMDDYFYPGTNFPDDASFVKYNSNNFLNKADWRRNNVNLLIQSIHTFLEEYDQTIQFGISPSGVWDNLSSNPLGSSTRGGNPSYSKLYADTRKWALEGWIDYIAPQIYWENGNSFCDYATLLNWWSTTLAACDTKLYIAMADYRANEVSASNPWYQGVELSKQLHQNEENDIVKGELHYRYRSIITNPYLQTVISTIYQEQDASALNQ